MMKGRHSLEAREKMRQAALGRRQQRQLLLEAVERILDKLSIDELTTVCKMAANRMLKKGH